MAGGDRICTYLAESICTGFLAARVMARAPHPPSDSAKGTITGRRINGSSPANISPPSPVPVARAIDAGCAVRLSDGRAADRRGGGADRRGAGFGAPRWQMAGRETAAKKLEGQNLRGTVRHATD